MKFKKSVLAIAIISTPMLATQVAFAEDEFSVDDYFSDYDDLYDDEEVDTQNDDVSTVAEQQASDDKEITPDQPEKTEIVQEAIQYSDASASEIEDAEELDVTGYFIPDEKKETSQIANVLSFDDMAKTGDSNAGDALKRVSGLSLVGGKFIYVRGLDDRYSSALLNGAVLPSPEPNKKVAPMDIFPTNVLESVLVQKTYSPEFPGEFAGGIIQMRSKALPDLPFTKVSFGTGFLTGSTFSDGYHNEGGAFDWLGFDDGTRAYSDELQAAFDANDNGRVASSGPFRVENIEEIGESFYRQYTPEEFSNLPPANFSVSYGNRWDIGQNSYGIIGSTSYSSMVKNREEERNKFSGNGSRTGGYDYNYTTEEASLNAMVTSGVEIGFDHTIKMTTLFIQDSQDTFALKDGNWDQDTDPDATKQEYFIEYIERQLFSNQIDGKHQFDLFDAFWKANYSNASRNAPNTTQYSYFTEDGVSSLFTNSDDFKHAWYELDDTVVDLSADLEHHIFKGQLEGSIKGGVGFLNKSRDSEARKFRFEQQVTGTVDIEGLSPEEILTDENIDGSNSTGYLLTETTSATDNYTGNKAVFSGYVQADYPFNETVRGTAGVRVEKINQSVTTADIFDPVNDTVGEFDKLDILPVMTGTYIFSDAQQMRFAVSRTVARPDFREMSSAQYYDVETGSPILGNPDLQPTTIDSVDTRFEWYGKNDREFTFGAFFKSFENHIEKTVEAGPEGRVTYMNLSRANNFGFEVEVKNDLGLSKSRLSDFYVSGNLTYINSTLSLTDEEKGVMTNNERPMQGQSDWLANIQMGYDNINTGTQGTLVYNYTGQRIDEAGRFGFEDVYEDGRGTLDFIYKQNVPGQVGLAISFKAKNILNSQHTYSQDDNIVREYQEGAKFTISISKTWEALPIDIWSDD